jgi:hypothetical protein
MPSLEGHSVARPYFCDQLQSKDPEQRVLLKRVDGNLESRPLRYGEGTLRISAIIRRLGPAVLEHE